MNHSEIVSFLWGVADLIRDTFKRGKYQDVILEALNENPGEHITPRDVVHRMVDLLLAGDEARIRRKGTVITVCDPCCGWGGMLLITKEHITIGVRRNGEVVREPINPEAGIHARLI